MFSFSKQERAVLLSLAFVIAAGSVLTYSFKKYPFLKDIVNLIDSDKLYFKVDVNTASLEELVSIPFIGEYTAKEIIKFRSENGGLKSLEEIKSISGIRKENFKIFSKYLTVKRN